jgi:hypothetical protein
MCRIAYLEDRINDEPERVTFKVAAGQAGEAVRWANC